MKEIFKKNIKKSLNYYKRSIALYKARLKFLKKNMFLKKHRKSLKNLK